MSHELDFTAVLPHLAYSSFATCSKLLFQASSANVVYVA